MVLSKLNLYSFLKKLKEKNKIIYGVGAPSRAATLVNYVGLNEDILNYILEIKDHIKLENICRGLIFQ